jgi:hypothetical protein
MTFIFYFLLHLYIIFKGLGDSIYLLLWVVFGGLIYLMDYIIRGNKFISFL